MQPRKTQPAQPEMLVCEDCARTSATDSTVKKRTCLFEDVEAVLCETCYANRETSGRKAHPIGISFDSIKTSGKKTRASLARAFFVVRLRFCGFIVDTGFV